MEPVSYIDTHTKLVQPAEAAAQHRKAVGSLSVKLRSRFHRNKREHSLQSASFELIVERLSLCGVQVPHFVPTHWRPCRSCVVFTSVLVY